MTRCYCPECERARAWRRFGYWLLALVAILSTGVVLAAEQPRAELPAGLLELMLMPAVLVGAWIVAKALNFIARRRGDL